MELSGVLLVGGASERFGSPKALAVLGGETLAGRAWRLLGDACTHRIAVGKRADGLDLPFGLLDDGTDVRAPLAGLVAGLRASTTDLTVVIPVDCPQLTVEALHRLAAACRDAAVPQTGPLPGAYRRSALPVLERRLAAGGLRLRDALAELDTVTVPLPEEVLVNVNRPADLELAWIPWLSDAAERLGLPGELTPEEEAILLDRARIAAHESGARTNAPLYCYLLGLAAGRSGRSLDELVA